MYAVLIASAALVSAAEAKPAKQFTPVGEVVLANSYAAALSPEQRPYALFISLHDIPAEDLVLYSQVTSGVVNSLSDAPVMIPAKVVPGSAGTLLYFDLTLSKIPRKALDDLAKLGSGAAPFPEPFFHQLVKEVSVSKEASGDGPILKPVLRSKAREPVLKSAVGGRLTVIQGPWLEPAIDSLTALTHADAPIFEARWFWANALIEPRYHELLGVGDSIADFQRLAHVDEATAEKLGAQVRGAILDSEVGARSRIVERTPTAVRFGRGAFHQSYDFVAAVNAKDVLKDLLIEKADANESILTRRNGLQAYFVNDANGKRLDKADPDVAQDSRTRLRDHQVWTGFHCMGCHESEKGIIPVVDEVRIQAAPDLEVVSKRFAGGSRERGQTILEKYFSIDVNELLQQDQVYFEAAVLAATTLPDYPAAQGLSCVKYSSALQRGIWEYVDRKVDLAELAVEVGYPEIVVRQTIERNPGLDHSLVGMLKHPQRRDQVEAGVAPMSILLGQQTSANPAP